MVVRYVLGPFACDKRQDGETMHVLVGLSRGKPLSCRDCCIEQAER